MIVILLVLVPTLCWAFYRLGYASGFGTGIERGSADMFQRMLKGRST